MCLRKLLLSLYFKSSPNPPNSFPYKPSARFSENFHPLGERGLIDIDIIARGEGTPSPTQEACQRGEYANMAWSGGMSIASGEGVCQTGAPCQSGARAGREAGQTGARAVPERGAGRPHGRHVQSVPHRGQTP